MMGQESIKKINISFSLVLESYPEQQKWTAKESALVSQSSKKLTKQVGVVSKHIQMGPA